MWNLLNKLLNKFLMYGTRNSWQLIGKGLININQLQQNCNIVLLLWGVSKSYLLLASGADVNYVY